MKNSMAPVLSAFVVGLLFSIGLALAGMTQPQKIISFLDPWHWDPALIFVMGAALFVHIIGYRWVTRRKTPVLDSNWHIPQRQDVTIRLLVGSTLFGIGWGLGGFCPGPGLSSLFVGDYRALQFVGFMVLGMFVYHRVQNRLPLKG